ncbi:phage terminase small subunit [Sphingomonas sp. Leaf4]|uniref:phage terminase small subunit n=1 Tax=Sphingomonas sp. Leaf4 TaxID=2876553 RepID=UPI001E2B7858|nr:phage terminase small subunit [Sphingomonas sp. Leaf4]
MAAPIMSRAAATAAAQVAARLTFDLRRLKEIKAVSRKIDAKRQMLPEYRSWIDGLMSGALQAGAGASGDVLPTIMVWYIDVGDYAAALPLIEHVLAHKLKMPARYVRDAPTLIVEEIAVAAMKAQSAGDPFDLSLLETVEALTADDDMHDEVRAKLLKAIGYELDRTAYAAAQTGGDALGLLSRSILALRTAQDLNARVGVKTFIRGVEKRIAAAQPTPPEA